MLGKLIADWPSADLEQHFLATLGNTAQQLEKAAAKHSRTGHYLCAILAEAANALDPEALSQLLGESVAEALVQVDVPRWVATICGQGIADACQYAIGPLSPGHQVIFSLRLLALVVCPDPDHCPDGDQVSVELLKQISDGSTRDE